jgi:Flp pilus assembly protein TadG
VTRGRARGQAIVEFAFTLPLFVVFVLVTFQLGLLFIAYYSETRMARETARWAAVHSKTTDDAALADHVNTTMLPGLVGGTPSVAVGTSILDATATVGKMTVRYTPCVISSGICTRANRVSGTTLYVDMSYDVSDVLFLPATWHLGSLVVNIPTTLPAYRVYMMVE